MVAVSLLGHVSVSVDGAPVSGEAAQRRRVALLALLCTPPAHPISRDRLMLYLWPENDVESARHLLSVAVHVLRKAVGHDVLVTTADEVSLAPHAVEVDVAAFEDAVARGDHEAAVSSYGGPFMDGFHAGAGVELEQWIDGERTRLQRAYAQALEGLAGKRRSGGDVVGAAEAWRSLAALDPYSSHAALGLMRALAEAGNRAGAIRHAAVHRQLLEGELGAGPDPEVEALAEALRVEPPAGGADAVAQSAQDARAVETPASAQSAPAGAGAAPPTGVSASSPAAAATAAASAGSDPEATGAARPDTLPGLSSAVLTGLGSARPVPGVGQPLPRRWRRARWGAAGLFLVVLGLAGFYLAHRAAGRTPITVAVLPFTGRSQQPDSGYVLGDAMADRILDELGTVSGLRVIPRTSSFAYRGGQRDVRRIGRELSVQWVLDGSWLVSGDTLRVSVDLASTRDGTRVWNGEYSRPYTERFVMQGDVARSVARELDRKWREGAGPETRDVAAAELYERGRQAWFERTPAGLRAAIGFFEQAAAHDSTYARAYAGLAEALTVAGSYDYGLFEPDSAYPRAEAAAQRALRLDPRLADAHAALGNMLMDYKWDVDSAEVEFRRALDYNPGYLPAREWLALLLVSQGRGEEALAQLDSAARNNPRDRVLFVQRAQVNYYMHQYGRAKAELLRALDIDSTYALAHLFLALTQAQSGEAAEAVQRASLLARQAQVPPVMAVLGYARARAGDHDGAVACRDWLSRAARRHYVPAELLALVDVGLGDKQAALDHLSEAYGAHSDGMLYLAVEPGLDPLRAEPRFIDLLQRTPAGRPDRDQRAADTAR